MSAEKSRLSPRLIAGAGAVLVAAAGVIWWVTHPPSRPRAPVAVTDDIPPNAAVTPPAAATPMGYVHKTPQAEVELKLPASVQGQPDLHARLYAEGVKELKAFAESEGVVEEHADPDTQGLPAFSHQIDWSTASETAKLLSLRKDAYEFAGGAHPNTALGALLWDKALKKPLQPQALFRKGADFAKLDTALCDAVIAAKQARLKADYQAPGQGWTCPRWMESAFVLAPSTSGGKAGGLTFLFSPYAIGAYAEGPYEITLPLSIFASALAPGYADEFSGAPAKVGDTTKTL